MHKLPYASNISQPASTNQTFIIEAYSMQILITKKKVSGHYTIQCSIQQTNTSTYTYLYFFFKSMKVNRVTTTISNAASTTPIIHNKLFALEQSRKTIFFWIIFTSFYMQ